MVKIERVGAQSGMKTGKVQIQNIHQNARTPDFENQLKSNLRCRVANGNVCHMLWLLTRKPTLKLAANIHVAESKHVNRHDWHASG